MRSRPKISSKIQRRPYAKCIRSHTIRSNQSSHHSSTTSSDPAKKKVISIIISQIHKKTTLPLPLHLHLNSSRLRLLLLLHLHLSPLLIRTPTVVKIANMRTVKHLFLQRPIDFVMHMTCPRRRVRACGDLGWEFGEDLAEVGGAFATGMLAISMTECV